MSEKLSFKDLVAKYGVDSEILNKQCTLNDDKFREYCDPRKLVGQHLGLTQQEVDNIDRDHDTEEEKQLATMQKWKRKFTYNATYRKLIEALLACEREDNAAELCKLLSERDHIVEDIKEMYRNLSDTYGQTPSWDACWQGKFPPLLTPKKFNLALVEIGHIRTGNVDDYVKMTITGKVDDIRRQKHPIELKDLFSGIDGGRKVVVLEGAPGSGKSTICLSICQQWGKEELFQEFKVVILVQLRNPIVQKATSVEDLIQVLDPKNAKQLADRLLSTCCQDVLFILDGWDKLPTEYRTHQHILHRLIEPTPGDNLEKSAVIVTSRPIATYSIPVFSKPKVRQVEVVGFFCEELEQFFTECLDNDTSKARDLMKRIDSTPSLAGSCHLPLNANIIAHLYKDQKHTLPPTQFGIFSKLVCDYLARSESTKVDEVDSLESDELSQEVRESLNAICKLAYDKMMVNEATFELPDPKFETLDLVHGIETFKNIKTKNRKVFWCFVHLTVQEFLAARYLARSLSEEEQIALFSKHIEEPRFSQMFQFYTAITQLRHPEFGEIISSRVKQYGSPNATIEQKHLLLSLLHCMYEANSEELCQSLAKDLPHDGLTLSNITLRPSDCVCIGYILSCIIKTQSESEFIVNLVNCKINDLSCQMLVSNLLATSCASTMLKLNISCNDISPEGICSICHLLQHNSVQTLDLGDNHSITNTGIEQIFGQLKTNTSLKQLHLFGCELTNNGLTFIADALPHNKTLEELDLSYNDLRISTVEDKGLEKLANALKADKCQLKVLHLSNCCLSDSEVDQVIQFLQSNTTMEVLLLNNYQYRQSVVNPNVISTGKVSDFTKCLTHNGTLLKLTLPVEITPFIADLQSTVNKVREERGQQLIKVNVERASTDIL